MCARSCLSGRQAGGQFDLQLISGCIKSKTESLLRSPLKKSVTVCLHACIQAHLSVTGKINSAEKPSLCFIYSVFFLAKGKTLVHFDN